MKCGCLLKLISSKLASHFLFAFSNYAISQLEEGNLLVTANNVTMILLEFPLASRQKFVGTKYKFSQSFLFPYLDA